MKKSISFVLFLLIGIILCGSVNVSAKDNSYAKKADKYLKSIIEYNLEVNSSKDINEWITDGLTADVGGTAEWYMLGLLQYSYALKADGYAISDKSIEEYRRAIEDYVENNTVRGSSARLKFALLLHAAGSDSKFIDEALNDGSIGAQGIMSYVFGLHLLNNGYESSITDTYAILAKLADMQHADGGWSIMGDKGDVDVTAMTLSALAPIKDTGITLDTGSAAKSIDDIISDGLAFLSEKQLEDGDYQSYGARNAESIAQVITALSALGIDCTKDERFIKNGNNPIDGLSLYRQSDGSFAHMLDGKSNSTATVQTFYSLIAYERMLKGKSPLFIIASGKKKDKETTDKESGENGVAEGAAEGSDKGEADDAGFETPGDTAVESGTVKSDAESEATGDTAGNSDTGKVEDAGNEASDDTSTEGEFTDDVSGETDTSEGDAGENETTEITAGESEAADGDAGGNEAADDDTGVNVVVDGDARENEAADVTKEDAGQENTFDKDKNTHGYKLYTCIILVLLCAAICAILAALKKHRKNIIFTLAVTIAAVLFVVFTDFSSTEDYYGRTEPALSDTISTGTVNASNVTSKEDANNNVAGEADAPVLEAEKNITMSIRCDIVKGEIDSEYIPKDGCILDVTRFVLRDQDTAYDVLIRAAKEYRISVDHKGSGELIYISGINYLYELDYGDLSGWVYKVNGELPSVGCAAYKLNDGDVIEWCYTLDLGNDTFD